MLWRPRLAEALDAGVRRAVTVICAGPGWGKTALAASWAGTRSLSGPVAWLTLEARHNNPVVFRSDLIMALRAAGSGLPDTGSRAADDDPALFRRLVSGLAGLPQVTVLVLDDLHEVTDPQVLNDLAGILHTMPDRLRFVLISRTEPGVPLHRLRAAGELTEIGAAALAFRVDEASQLLALQGRRPSVEEVAVRVRRAEGWGAGLRLGLEDLGGKAIEDYLVREVLATQPPQFREFLLSTSLTDRICGELAEVLTGQNYGHRTLERLAQSNLFVERIGMSRWFRYHGMFRAALRHQISIVEPERVPQLHLLTAQWFAAKGNGLVAITHAAAGGDWEFVARLVVDHGLQLFASVDREDFIAVLRRIPAERLMESAELSFCAALMAFADHDVASVPQRIARARTLLAGRGPRYRAVVDLALNVLESGVVIRWRGDMPHLVAVSSQLLDELTTLRWDQVPARLHYRAMALNHKGAGLLWTGRLDHAERFLWAAASAGRSAGVPLVEINALAHLSLLVHLQGALNAADEHANAAIDLAGRIDAKTRPASAVAYLTRALTEAERGREAETESLLRRGLHAIGDEPEAAPAVVVALVRARLLLDRREPLAARAVLYRALAEAGPHFTASLLVRLLGLGMAEADLALGDPAAVITRYAHRPAVPALMPAEQVCLARAYQDSGDPAAAEELLARVREGSDRVSAVSAWILTALAADAQGHGGRAGEALSRALAEAEPELIRQPFRRFGAPRMLVLAERQQWLNEARGPAGDNVLAEITGEIPIIGGTPAAGPLSEREQEVLKYLPTVLTAAEIAENLGISVNTVKAHMRSIYRKLGAGRRREAVVLSRQLGLL
ncbi:LuxR family maltose regulon positive regulatory protein [Actinoplanes lutulentus]|uniref:LuxR C-terminal-related transcriptional regulator n=1 Tax=Actinoplanes lutulentus TaxID=1287878 RepID=UPI000DB915A9|nr:LuxR C-terminal-related transcriptional regulator [Actinoplanes lutulentus]MBB2941292.1 LuxR family maltose regulon positive regulatory protein [Actinoplanes lutulentus]